MKDLKYYIKEKLIVFHPQIDEKLVVNKNYKSYYYPKSWDDLRELIRQRYKEQGPGTKQEPIDFNDIDVSKLGTLASNNNRGVFEETEFKYIDVSEWNVSNIKSMQNLFFACSDLVSIGDISNWNVSNVKYMGNMFRSCYMLESIGNLSKWKVSNVENMQWMFYYCKHLKTVGDLSKWDISGVTDMQAMFTNSGITNTPDWYKE